MHELLSQAFGYLAGLWRFRWVALIAAWVVALLGWVFVWQMPDQFMATARIQVDTNSVLRPLLKGVAIQPNINQRVALLSKTLLSRPNLEKLARMTDMDLGVQTEEKKEQLYTDLRSAIGLAGDRRNKSLYSVSFYHEDRVLAKSVVQALISIFVETAIGDKRGDSSDAQDFIDKQIEEYEKRLETAESALADFKQKHAGILPGDKGGYYQRLTEAKNNLSDAKLKLREMTNRRDELSRQLDGEQPVFLSSGSVKQQVSSELDGRINSLQGKLDYLLSKYTQRHPEVKQISSLIAELKAERKAELAKSSNNVGEPEDLSGLNNSPVYQQMRTMLAEAEASVAELSVRVNEYQGRVDELNSMVDKIPLIEAELTQLNRDYKVVSGQHTKLLTRRESARISEDAEQQASDIVFKVIDPPFVPLMPNKPQKTLLNAGVLVASLGFGGGLALLLSLIKPVVADRRRLASVSGAPVLGTVLYVPTPQESKRAKRRRIKFILLFLLLLVAFVAVTVAHRVGVL